LLLLYADPQGTPVSTQDLPPHAQFQSYSRTCYDSEDSGEQPGSLLFSSALLTWSGSWNSCLHAWHIVLLRKRGSIRHQKEELTMLKTNFCQALFSSAFESVLLESAGPTLKWEGNYIYLLWDSEFVSENSVFSLLILLKMIDSY
jgi:hypothetical protein